MPNPDFPIVRWSAVFLLVVTMVAGTTLRMEAQTNSNPAPATVETPTSNEILRAYLQLQEQIHEAQLAIQRAGHQNELAAMQTTAMLSNRLQAVELAVETQRSHEMKVVRDIMIIAGTFVVVGVFALLFTAYFHWRAVSRLAEIASALPNTRASTPAAAALASLGEGQILLEQNSSRLVNALERLEKRISEAEQHTTTQLGNGQAITTNGNGSTTENRSATFSALPEPAETLPPRVVDSTHAEEFISLTNQGQSFLSQDQAEEALACFEKALALDPSHAEMLVKKGDALEKLRRTDEAIACYDRALAIDEGLTIAYLHKGGLLNRLERFDEAMQCYEQALRSQEKKRAA